MAESCSSNGHEVNRAFLERHFFGYQELHVSEEFEANLTHYNTCCQKNPGHKQFIPAIDFNIDNLPDDYQDEDIVSLIRATADLTVRISVRHISVDRPKTWPETEFPYPLSEHTGTEINSSGTGIIWNISVYDNKSGDGTCICKKCENTMKPSEVWGEIGVFTAKHVVFDSVEAKHTACRLFFDTNDSELVKCDGWFVAEDNLEEDWCRMKYPTCDMELLSKLYRIRSVWDKVHHSVYYRYKTGRNDARLNFIVSHPHGCPKYVSVGHWVKRLVVKVDTSKENVKYTYTTCTCPGTSGALVHTVGYGGWDTDQVHSGVNFDGVNFSCTGYELKQAN